jgi:hypothetical protein
MKTIIFIFIIFLIVSQDVASQCLGYINPTSGGWQSVDPPTIRWQTGCSPCNGCSGVFLCINRGSICPPYFPMTCNWQMYLFSMNDSCYTVPNSLWSQFVADTQYRWLSKVQGSMGSQWYNCNGPITRLNAVLPPVTLNSPPNNSAITTLTPLLKWNPLSGAVSYKVRIYYTQGLSVILFDSLLTRDSLYIPPGKLVNNHTYWWSVKSYKTGGEGPFADVYAFTTNLNSGIKIINSEIPESFELYQNYPNPFNPSTQIEFSIPKNTSQVKLTVFDITGKIISTLVEEKLNAGTYKADFYGEGLSSGIYFYKLETSEFTETKRMVLIK